MICDQCKGRKTFSALGGIDKKCNKCQGLGLLNDFEIKEKDVKHEYQYVNAETIDDAAITLSQEIHTKLKKTKKGKRHIKKMISERVDLIDHNSVLSVAMNG